MEWRELRTTGEPPIPRRAHTANYRKAKIIVFAGGDGVRALRSVHALDLSHSPPR